MGRPSSLLLIVPAPPRRALPADWKKAPLTNLCSRLVVNEYPRDPSIPERPAHTVPTDPSVAVPSPRMPMRGVGPTSSTSAPDSRKRHLRPRAAAHLLLRSLAATMIQRYPSGLSFPPLGRRHDLRRSFVGPTASRVVWSLTLPVTVPIQAGSHRLVSAPPRTLSTSDAPTPLLSRPEAPSTDESHSPTARAGA
jgi:hypothetical protein